MLIFNTLKKLSNSLNIEFKQKDKKSKDFEDLNKQLKVQIQKIQEENKDLQQRCVDTQKQNKEQIEKYQKDIDNKTNFKVANLTEQIGN